VLRARKTGMAVIRRGFIPDVVWVSSPPLFVGLVGPSLRRRARRAGNPEARFALDVRDIWPDTAVAAGQISGDGRAYRVGRRLECWIYRRADAMSCVARPMREYLERESGGAPVAVVYNGVSTRATSGGRGPEAREADAERAHAGAAENGRPAATSERPRREILYAGNWGRLQGLDPLLSAWAEVCELPFFAAWELRLVGNGVMEAALREHARTLGIEHRVRFEAPVPKEQALALMEHAGLLFLNLRPDAVFSYTIPSKLFDYLRAGRPILGGIPGEGAEILRHSGGNVTFAPSDTESLVEAFHRAAEHYEEMLSAACGNRELVFERFTREAATQRLLALFASLGSHHHQERDRR
jgi:glycosyltransferase involved in cell wall biosynthesis